MFTIPLLLLSLLGAGAECPGDGSVSDLRVALEGSEALAGIGDLRSFSAQQSQVRGRVRCLDEVVTPATAAVLHSLEALAAESRGETEYAVESFVASQSWPGMLAPEWLGDRSGAIYARWEQASLADPQVWQSLRVAEGFTLYMDGVPVEARPAQRPAVAQVTDRQGQVVWSALLTPGQPVPLEYAALAPERIGVSGDDVLAEAIALLEGGQFHEAVQIAVPAVSQYPDLAVSFLAVAELATDQIHRTDVVTVAAAARREHPPLRAGVDLGMPTGLRVEWGTRSNFLTGWGLRGGLSLTYANSAWFHGIAVSVPFSIYADFRLYEPFEIETWAGFVWFSSSVYGLLGAGGQWDPEGPLQVTVGGSVGPYSAFSPEATATFLW